MTKYKAIFNTVLVLLFILLSIMAWRASRLFDNLSTMIPEATTHRVSEPNKNTARDNVPRNITPYRQQTNDDKPEHSEIIERIKRDVIVTGTITGTPGKESAMLQIAGKPDMSFNIDTPLMDDFFITAITQRHIVLKNKTSHEVFSITVQSGGQPEPSGLDTINSNTPSSYSTGSGFIPELTGTHSPESGHVPERLNALYRKTLSPTEPVERPAPRQPGIRSEDER